MCDHFWLVLVFLESEVSLSKAEACPLLSKAEAFSPRTSALFHLSWIRRKMWGKIHFPWQENNSQIISSSLEKQRTMIFYLGQVEAHKYKHIAHIAGCTWIVLSIWIRDLCSTLRARRFVVISQTSFSFSTSWKWIVIWPIAIASQIWDSKQRKINFDKYWDEQTCLLQRKELLSEPCIRS